MQKWMYVVIVIVAVVAVVGVVLGVRYLVPERPPVENGNGIPDVATATSLRFGMEFMEGENGDVIGEVIWLAKNIGTDQFKLRIEGSVFGFRIGYIVNGELGRAWVSSDDGWGNMPPDNWSADWDDFVNRLDEVIRELQECTQGDCSYFDPEDEQWVRIYDISINPDLDDALFEP